MTYRHTPKKGISVAEISVAVIVLGVLLAAVVPIFMRMGAYKRNTTRMLDVKKIGNMAISYHGKSGSYPTSLRELETGLGEKTPKDPKNKAYCTNQEGYQTGDYQYFFCEDCIAVGPYKNHAMKHVVQVGALMERENKRGERNSGNRWTPYGIGESSDCAANGIWGVGTILENMRGNRLEGTGATTMQTRTDQEKYEPRYSEIFVMEKVDEVKNNDTNTSSN